MSRQTQGALLLILGAVLLTVSAFSTMYLNYVKPGFRPFLIAAGAVLVVVAVATLVEERRRSVLAGRQALLANARIAEDVHLARLTGREPAAPPQDRSPGHEHGEGGRVAWLLAAPVAVLLLISPPSLGSYAAQRAEQAPPPPPPAVVDPEPVRPLKSDRVNVLTMGEFADRAWYRPRSLAGKTVRLSGFVLPSARKGEWYLARMRIGCCAADAMTMKVVVRGAPAPAADTWVRVTGTWVPREGPPPDTYVPEMTASDVQRISSPAEPYE
ncbi:TIGR03943 family protein [Nonomuraea mesophila]|uniref:TIGR03943 family protein n=1 Tax=Nonomuraea mesophila TaxID=2530382 RepID=A0A4V2ZBH4_9ACTN|nr:TIGR03943 family protein [Nonomuraea mesophila]TDE56551.1 TIGR03943 family protein [Nonomuraea mesophila]